MKRYDVEPCGDDHCYTETSEHVGGDWVRYEDHAAEVERLRELLECAQGDRDTWERMYYENRDEKREAAIYGAVIAWYGEHPHALVMDVACKAADAVVKAWRAAQKGGSDG